MANQYKSYKDEYFSNYSSTWSKSREAFINEFVIRGGVKSEPEKQTDVSVPLLPSLE
jgi:hypothetical protein